jgi:hypothetical protein
MSRWFRFYDDAINDPKVLRLSDAMFRAWVTLLCIASKHDGVLPPTGDVALMLRIKIAKVAEWLAALTAAGLIDNDDGVFAPHNWNARQFKSDVSTERVKRFRKQQRNVSETVIETAPETEQKQITETEQSREERARKRGARLAVDWKPSAEDANEAMKRLGGAIPAEQELLKFHDYWKAQPGQRGIKLDWDATWRNWIRNAKGQPNGRRTVHDAARDQHENLLNRIAAFDEPAPGRIRDGTGEDVVRLLPPR